MYYVILKVSFTQFSALVRTIFVDDNKKAENILRHSNVLPNLYNIIMFDRALASTLSLAKSHGVAIVQYRKVVVSISNTVENV